MPPPASPPPHQVPHAVECHDCGLLQRLPELPRHTKARCRRCEAVLHRRKADPSRRTLALGLAGTALMVPVLWTPLMDFDFRGHIRAASVFTGPAVLDQSGMAAVGLLVLAVVVVVPALRLLALLAVLLGLRLPRPPPGLATLFRFYRAAARWSMIEVFLLGTFVAYNRLAQMATIVLGPAMAALALLMVASVAIDAALDADAVWNAIGNKARPRVAAAVPERAGSDTIGCPHCKLLVRAVPGGSAGACPRCGGALWRRRPLSLARTWALLIAAAILYIPANYYPVMTIVSFGRAYPSTILAGVDELAAEGMWPLAALVFFASITVPLLKLLGLGLLLVSVHRGWEARLRDRTRLYRVVEWIGRWSMIDVFAVSLLVALIQMGLLASITPGRGAPCFAAVVVLTMLAAASFDPRLMWDAAAQRASRQPAGVATPVQARS